MRPCSNVGFRCSYFKGDVANEVETEQICADGVASDLSAARMTSFVQVSRSSVGAPKSDVTVFKSYAELLSQGISTFSI